MTANITPKSSSGSQNKFKLTLKHSSSNRSLACSSTNQVSPASLSISPNSSSSPNFKQHKMVILNCIDEKFYLSGRMELIKSVFPEIKDELLSKFKNSEIKNINPNNGASSTTNEESETTSTTVARDESLPDDYLTRLCINDLDIGVAHLVQLMERLYDNNFSLEAHYSQSSKLNEKKIDSNEDDDQKNTKEKSYEYVFVKSK